LSNKQKIGKKEVDMKHITSASVFSLLIILFSGCIGFPVYEQPVYILVPNQQVQTVKVCDVSGWFCHSAYMPQPMYTNQYWNWMYRGGGYGYYNRPYFAPCRPYGGGGGSFFYYQRR